ncbi:hypothetical protein DF107_02635 [Burkholderia stagnalis]|uniref:hypothetical protein n=1 Tax=Burkholderia stagnalis TaxID=1503054 RepID=UPI000F5AD01D|nr:hypothetical protein [Burkholderia stagnalis]RQQ21302.1 hypothetical protein DF161_00595 [Burkholderia stagnalis]RQY84953.1 hypothetical protein DF107_02635 [Burkholderia stagnalis]
MEVKFGRVSWDDLNMIRKAIKMGGKFDGIKDMQRKLIAGMAKAIDLEIKRKEMAGEALHGTVILSLDLKIEPERRIDSGGFGKRISLRELDELANERQRIAIEEEARLKRIEALENAERQAKADLASGVN